MREPKGQGHVVHPCWCPGPDPHPIHCWVQVKTKRSNVVHYSGDSNSGLVWYSDHVNVFDSGMVRYSNGIWIADSHLSINQTGCFLPFEYQTSLVIRSPLFFKMFTQVYFTTNCYFLTFLKSLFSFERLSWKLILKHHCYTVCRTKENL